MSVICLNAFGAVATTPVESAQKVKSAAQYIIGNTVHGTEDDGEFFDYYAPDGSATSKLVENNDITHGRWTIENDNLCLDYPNDTKACYSVQGAPPAMTLTDVGTGKVFVIQLLRGNPQKL